ncbi:nucleotidyl transferase AbiEii/AbiGii toxin family protein [Paremcibacter congregatus]|uniref:nucleotidyl transferase AbiEii/AbiGii toxin family protein n=1 Tax=Paremcibacter congregatus TaxID=2043170 RepID=UPI003A8CEA57
MIAPAYRAQVDLLLQVMPHVAKEECFALKGGTAINMFLWNMPRLSVDIDLTYLPFEGRAAAMENITAALLRIKDHIEAVIAGCRVRLVPQSDGQEAKLTCQTAGAQIKIEVNTTMRGYIFPPQQMDIADAVEEEFGRFVSMNVVSPAELFGGKICAALDRQHPRDLFDVHKLFLDGGLSEGIRQGFLVGLLSSPRPIHEMLRPNFLDQRRTFETQFAGMTEIPFSYDDFEKVRERLITDIHAGLTDDVRRFLLGFKNAEPDWSLFPHDRLRDLPAVQWKLRNIEALKVRNPKKHAEQLRKLEKRL